MQARDRAFFARVYECVRAITAETLARSLVRERVNK